MDGHWGQLSIIAADRWVSEQRRAIAAMVQPADRAVILEGRANIGFLRTLAAQIYLKQLGPYTGAIDGQWGPLSRSAANAWAAVHFPPEPLDSTHGSLTPYGVAQRYLGVREIPGKNHNGTILNWLRRLQVSVFDDETPWCSTFVNFCALESGFERTGKLNARSWLDIGEHITTQDAREGDVIIFERGTSNWQGHVTFLVSADLRRGTMLCLGGNQSDQVNRATYPTSKLLGIRRLRSLDQLQGSSNKI
jgi:uncharacterized protein (TIGR02594 family)